jgi:hypothetical protein
MKKHYLLNDSLMFQNFYLPLCASLSCCFTHQPFVSMHHQEIKIFGLIPNEITGFFNWPDPSSRTEAMGLTQLLTEISTRNLPGSKGWLMCEADNLTAICEPTFWNTWESPHLITLWVSPQTVTGIASPSYLWQYHLQTNIYCTTF